MAPRQSQAGRPSRLRVKVRALVLLAGAQIAIGAAAIFARFALTAAGPLSVSALRLGIGALPLVAVALARGRFAVRDARTEVRLAGGGLLLALHFAAWIASLQHASVAVSTLLVCSTPIFTEAYAIVRARRLRPLAIAGIALALAGVAIVVGVPSRTETPVGIALALTGAVAMGAYMIVVRGCDARYDTLDVVSRTYPIAAIALTVAAFAVRDPWPPPGAHAAWAGILAMALVSQLFGHTALNSAVRVVSVTLVATATLLEPLIAAVAAALVFGERLGPATFAGAALIFGAIALAIRAER